MESESSSDQQRAELVQHIAQVQGRLRGFIRSLLIRPEDVDDLLQDVNQVLWEKADQYEPGTNFWAWASQIARFKVLNKRRAYGRNRFVFDDDFLAQLADVAEDRFAQLDDRRIALDHCLRSLPNAQRRLLDLRYFEEQSINEVASAAERSVASVTQTLYRIRGALRSCIEKRLTQTPETL